MNLWYWLKTSQNVNELFNGDIVSYWFKVKKTINTTDWAKGVHHYWETSNNGISDWIGRKIQTCISRKKLLMKMLESTVANVCQSQDHKHTFSIWHENYKLPNMNIRSNCLACIMEIRKTMKELVVSWNHLCKLSPCLHCFRTPVIEKFNRWWPNICSSVGRAPD